MNSIGTNLPNFLLSSRASKVNFKGTSTVTEEINRFPEESCSGSFLVSTDTSKATNTYKTTHPVPCNQTPISILNVDIKNTSVLNFLAEGQRQETVGTPELRPSTPPLNEHDQICKKIGLPTIRYRIDFMSTLPVDDALRRGAQHFTSPDTSTAKITETRWQNNRQRNVTQEVQHALIAEIDDETRKLVLSNNTPLGQYDNPINFIKIWRHKPSSDTRLTSDDFKHPAINTQKTVEQPSKNQKRKNKKTGKQNPFTHQTNTTGKMGKRRLTAKGKRIRAARRRVLYIKLLN